MKTLKMYLALLLSVVMLISTGTAALGEEYKNVPSPEDGFTITIVADDKDQGIHKYEAYQIFSGTLAQVWENGAAVAGAYILSDIVWGSGITEAGQTTLGNARTYAKSITDANIAEKADKLAQYLTKTTVGSWNPDDHTITGLTPGYYLVQDVETSPDTSGTNRPGAKTKFIVQIVADQTVVVKSSAPSVNKKVKEKNDPTGTTSGWQDAADYDIGDKIPYKLEGTLPSTFEGYHTYKHYTFIDTLSAGLTPPAAEEVKITLDTEDGASLANLFDVSVDGQVITVKLKDGVDLKTAKVTVGENEVGFTATNKIIVTYEATLNDDAEIGSAGNPNTVYLGFTDDPNHTGEGDPYGPTPEDKVTVFTFQLNVLKVGPSSVIITDDEYAALDDETKAGYALIDGKYYKTEALEGAGFTLYKWIGEETATVEPGEQEAPAEAEPTEAEPTQPNNEPENPAENVEDQPNADDNENQKEGDAPTGEGDVDPDNGDPTTGEPTGDQPAGNTPAAEDTHWVAVSAEVKPEDGNEFVFKGLDSGKYQLRETTTPAGYNTIDPVDFEVTATYQIDADDPKLLSLDVTPAAQFSWTVETVTTDTNVTTINTNGIISTTIVNLKGVRLPSVGGRGTVAFYLIGGAMVIGAAALLVMKRRKREEE